MVLDMALNATARRRWLGVLFLAGALLMLIAGETVFLNRLGGLAFLVYWLACFGLTGLAVVIALLDARQNRRLLREERRDLLQTTLKDIESAAGKKQRRNDKRQSE